MSRVAMVVMVVFMISACKGSEEKQNAAPAATSDPVNPGTDQGQNATAKSKIACVVSTKDPDHEPVDCRMNKEICAQALDGDVRFRFFDRTTHDCKSVAEIWGPNSDPYCFEFKVATAWPWRNCHQSKDACEKARAAGAKAAKLQDLTDCSTP